MPHRLRAINYRVFATLLVVGIPVLLFGSYFVIERGRAQLREAFGQTLAQRAEQSVAAIDEYVYRRIVDVSLLARVRHTNTIVISDRGFPFWPRIETVDISLVDDVPTVLQVLAALQQVSLMARLQHSACKMAVQMVHPLPLRLQT